MCLRKKTATDEYGKIFIRIVIFVYFYRFSIILVNLISLKNAVPDPKVTFTVIFILLTFLADFNKGSSYIILVSVRPSV